jgi:bifunctional DNA-binding transcriptional regulator/antitoxin component of YhaV-PrlF toxin-antitoxin module
VQTIKVQDCGCITLPDHIVEQTGLYPGSILSLAVSQDGKTIQLIPLATALREFSPPSGTKRGRS